MNSKPPSPNDRLYQDFQPLARWVTEESKTLQIHLPGFRKDQIRVQLDNLGSLKLSGERPLEGNKWSRFCLRMRIPKDSKFNDIHAKFVNNILQIVLPKKMEVPDYHPPAHQDRTSQTIANDHPKKTADKAETGNTAQAASYQVGIGGHIIKLNKPRRMLMVNVAVAITMVVAAGAYAVQRLTSFPSHKAGGNY